MQGTQALCKDVERLCRQHIGIAKAHLDVNLLLLKNTLKTFLYIHDHQQRARENLHYLLAEGRKHRDKS